MTPPDSGGEQGSLREAAARVIDSGRAYVKAEIALAKKTAKHRIEQAIPTAVLLAGAIVLVQATATALVMALGLFLRRWLGGAGGFAMAALAAAATAAIFCWIAAKRIKDFLR